MGNWSIPFLGWVACLAAFLTLDWEGSLISDVEGLVAGSSSSSVASSVSFFDFFARRAALDSARRFFFARSPMVDRKREGNLNLGSYTHVTLIPGPAPSLCSRTTHNPYYLGVVQVFFIIYKQQQDV